MTSPKRLLIALGALLCLVVVVWWLRPPQRPAAPQGGAVAESTPQLTPQAAAELLHRLNIGLAHLENGQLPDALADLKIVTQQTPEELAGQRDLLIAQLLQATTIDAASADRAAVIADAQPTLKAVQRLDPDSLATDVLSARWDALQGKTAEAMRLLARATAKEPDDLPTWYEQFQLGEYADQGPLHTQALDALNHAFTLSPTNLVVLLKRLEVESKEHDPAIVRTLEAGEPRWQQLAAGIQSRVRVNILEMATDAKEAATAGNWPLVERNVRRIINVVMPEEATRSDRRLVERHALEFVLDRFSAPVMQLAEQATPASPPPSLTFAPAPDFDRLNLSGNVRAVRAADFDLDTRLDVAVLQDGRLTIHHKIDDGWSPLATYEFTADMTHLLAIDLDDDVDHAATTGAADDKKGEPAGHPRCHQADLDVVLYGPDGVIALQNTTTESGRELQPLDLPEKLSQLEGLRQMVAADLDMDGDLDLLCLSEAGVSLWANRGDLTFADDLFSLTGVPDAASFTAVVALDWDDDLDPDVVLAGSEGRLSLLENLRHGEFQWRDLNAGAEMNVAAIAPLDRDGAWDLLLAGDGGLKRIRASRPIDGQVTLNNATVIDTTPLDAIEVADFNNDGPLDVLGSQGQGLLWFLGQADTSLTLAAPDVAAGNSSVANDFDTVDINGDGRLDVLAGLHTGLVTLLNTTQTNDGWLDVSLLAEQIKGNDLSASGRVNHYGLGSVLELRSGVRRQRQIVTRPATHFGLGTAKQADAIRVLWTNGVPENVIEPASRTFICERQTLKGSCPYLYGWNGEEFAFITDLLWASPLGLIGPDGKLVPARPWEYLKIDPQQLAVRDGRYELRLTEELWEAAYFDSVRLFAVDHPADVEIVTNEKVGPPSLAEHRLYTIRQRRRPVAAVDQRGRDVLPLISEQDERYVKLFDRKLRQGFTEPTTLELDLGAFDDAKPVTLFLRGWIYPTDTTINVALSQNPQLDGPVPLSLSVPDADGRWQTAIPFTGFPGGKTKTIAIDLTGKLAAGDHRIRLQTSNELYWDAIFFTVDEPEQRLEETELPLLRADLRTRGVSAPIVHPQFGPERYDYETVLPSPWLPMDGRFTRLGDVRDLLGDDDSRLVVMGSGDEVVLEFAAPPAPPAGWVRSFVIRNVGWDKDADLQTVYGQTVEPLPLVTQTAWPTDEPPPPTPDYEQYQREQQTRRMMRP